jgi:hypothetical protein
MMVSSFKKKECYEVSRPNISLINSNMDKFGCNNEPINIDDLTTEEIFDISFLGEDQDRNSNNIPGSNMDQLSGPHKSF